MLATKTAIIFQPFLGVDVKLDIDTKLHNANDMLEAYNKQAKTGEKKEIYNYIKSVPTKEYVAELKRLHESEQLQSLEFNSPDLRELEYNGEKPKVKWIIETKKWKFWWTRMCSHLLIDFMMWLSPTFKVQAIDFILKWEHLTLGRNSIKEGYKKMCLAIAECWACNYREEATLCNTIVTWTPTSNQRARFWEDQQKLMDDVQKMNAWYIIAWLDFETRKKLLIQQYS